MPARGPVVQVTTATRLPAASPERLTFEGAPMPRTTSHSVWPSATVPPTGAGVEALASAGPAGAMPEQAPSALTRSSAPTGRSGVSGGDSIEMLLMNRRLGLLNHWASLDNRSVPPEQPATSGATAANAIMSELGSF